MEDDGRSTQLTTGNTSPFNIIQVFDQFNFTYFAKLTQEMCQHLHHGLSIINVQ